MDISIIARSLIRLMFLHQWNEFFCGPSLRLEVIIVRSRRTCVHLVSVRQKVSDHSDEQYHKVDRAATPQDVSTGNDGSTAIEPF